MSLALAHQHLQKEPAVPMTNPRAVGLLLTPGFVLVREPGLLVMFELSVFRGHQYVLPRSGCCGCCWEKRVYGTYVEVALVGLEIMFS